MTGEAADVSDGLAAGASSLRDSAKWLVGGVVATAAGVFAGSSLTNFGSLSFDHHPVRLLSAIAGAAIGFFALGWIVRRALAVLTVESATFRELADAQGDPTEPMHAIAAEAARKYGSRLPLKATSLADLILRTQALPDDDPRREEIRHFSSKVVRRALFLLVRRRFDELTAILTPATALAVLGFGLFAWAANPPDRAAPPAPPAGARQ